MRVIAGTAKGRKLYTPSGSRIRPTSDRVKESLFSIITGIIGSFSGCSVIDIFAGTGNLGIEALSRGASTAVFIDKHPDSVALVKKNLDLTGFQEKSSVICKEAVAGLKRLEATGDSFGVVFLDPPYQRELLEDVLRYLSTSALIDKDSIVIAELSCKETVPNSFGPLHVFDRRTYGDTALIFLTLKQGDEPWTER